MEDQPTFIDIALPGYAPTTFERPYGDSDLRDDEFDRIAREIVRNYFFLQLEAKGKRREGANTWLLHVAYDLLVPMLQEERHEGVDLRLKEFKRYRRGQRPDEDSFFQWGLMAIFAHSPKSISRQTRERLGKRLYHAARHQIPLVLLTGFFKQIESKGLEARAAANEIEPGFEKWIVEQYCIEDGAFLSTYPEDIKKQIQQRIRRYNRR